MSVATRVDKIEQQVWDDAHLQMEETVSFLRRRWDRDRRCAVAELIAYHQEGRIVPNDILETGRAALRDVRNDLSAAVWAGLWPANLQSVIDSWID
jgi:hypothetical protein